jgi:hypothetical protein
MALVRICDRCGAPAIQMDPSVTSKSLVVPAGAQASNPVSADFSLQLGVKGDKDLCLACALSALRAYGKAVTSA